MTIFGSVFGIFLFDDIELFTQIPKKIYRSNVRRPALLTKWSRYSAFAKTSGDYRLTNNFVMASRVLDLFMWTRYLKKHI